MLQKVSNNFVIVKESECDSTIQGYLGLNLDTLTSTIH